MCVSTGIITWWIPTLAEQSKDFSIQGWILLRAPAGVPDEATRHLI